MSKEPLNDLERGSGSVPLCPRSQTPFRRLVPHSLDVCITKEKEIQARGPVTTLEEGELRYWDEPRGLTRPCHLCFPKTALECVRVVFHV